MVAPSIADPPLLRLVERSHAQPTDVIAPSGSDKAATNPVPSWGCTDDKSTVPSSSTFSTVTVAERDSVFVPSEALIVS